MVRMLPGALRFPGCVLPVVTCAGVSRLVRFAGIRQEAPCRLGTSRGDADVRGSRSLTSSSSVCIAVGMEREDSSALPSGPDTREAARKVQSKAKEKRAKQGHGNANDDAGPFPTLSIPTWQKCNSAAGCNADADLCIRIVSYNVLAQAYVKSDFFPGSPPACLKAKPRAAALKKLLLSLNADLLCLQELDEYKGTYATFFAENGYSSVYVKRPGAKKDGSAILFRGSHFELLAAQAIDYNVLARTGPAPGGQAQPLSRNGGGVGFSRDKGSKGPERGNSDEGSRAAASAPTAAGTRDGQDSAGNGSNDDSSNAPAERAAGSAPTEAAANDGQNRAGNESNGARSKAPAEAEREVTVAITTCSEGHLPFASSLWYSSESEITRGGSDTDGLGSHVLPVAPESTTTTVGSLTDGLGSQMLPAVPDSAESVTAAVGSATDGLGSLGLEPASGAGRTDESAEELQSRIVRYTRDCVGVMALFRLRCPPSLQSDGPSSSIREAAGAAEGSEQGQQDRARYVMVCSTHLFWDPSYQDVKLAQASHLLHCLDEFQRRVTERLGAVDVPVLVGGDFNSLPHDPVYQQMIRFGGACPLDFSSVNTSGTGEEPQVTTYVSHFKATIDYIFASKGVQVVELLALPSLEELEKEGEGVPNASHPSDHLPIGAKIVLGA